MEEQRIEQILDAAEEAAAAGASIEPTGFWKVVTELKRDPSLRERYGRRVAAIDRRAFESWAFLMIPMGLGTALMIVLTLGGLLLVAWAYRLEDPWSWLTFGAGTGVLLVTTHSLGHLLVGASFGMRFTHWFIGSLPFPYPGVKVDYESYLAVPPKRRAWMHASGALVTKMVPLALVGAAIAADLPVWVAWSLVAVSVITIITDVAWSTKASDWKKYHREMSFS